MNAETQVELMKLIIGYTLVGVFVFTAISTCLAMVNIIKFADRSQYNTLFKALIIEVVIGCVAMFSGLINLSPAATVKTIEKPLMEQNQSLEVEKNRLAGTVSDLRNNARKTESSLLAASLTNRKVSDVLSQLAAQAGGASASPSPPLDTRDLQTQVAQLQQQLDQARNVNESLNPVQKEVYLPAK